MGHFCFYLAEGAEKWLLIVLAEPILLTDVVESAQLKERPWQMQTKSHFSSNADKYALTVS